MKTVHSNKCIVSLFHVAAVSLVFLNPCSKCLAADHHAAIDHSPSTGAYGYYYGNVSLSTAKVRALNRCKGKDARVVAWVRNGYVCLALGKDRGAYGWGYGPKKAIARSNALNACRKRTTGCYIAVMVCSGW